jgi:hypothetical protein
MTTWTTFTTNTSDVRFIECHPGRMILYRIQSSREGAFVRNILVVVMNTITVTRNLFQMIEKQKRHE